ncbi:MAG: hemolysin family protein [Acidobacteriota bacterium]
MSEALASWWGNPVTAILVAGGLWLVLAASAAGLVAVVRLGGISLGGLLAQRAELLPGFPRRGEAHGSLILFLGAGQGCLLLLFYAAVLRAGRLAGAGGAGSLSLLRAAWALAAVAALALAREPRVEPLARLTVVSLRPWVKVLLLLAQPEAAGEEAKPQQDSEIDEHEVQAFIGAGEEAGILEREDAELITSIVELSETVAREIMTPRIDVVALPVSADFATVQQQFAESMFTRIPVYRDTVDRIEGLLHVKDVLKAVAAGEAPAAGELLRNILIVPETKPLRELLREFQSARQQLAVVVDEYGGTSGIVTLEDVLEEIVGEIQDEHQQGTPEVEKEDEGVYLITGGAHVEVLEELFGVALAEAGFDSVAGLVLDRLGRLPRPGEKINWQGLELEAVEVDRRRLRRLRVRGGARQA